MKFSAVFLGAAALAGSVAASPAASSPNSYATTTSCYTVKGTVRPNRVPTSWYTTTHTSSNGYKATVTKTTTPKPYTVTKHAKKTVTKTDYSITDTYSSTTTYTNTGYAAAPTVTSYTNTISTTTVTGITTVPTPYGFTYALDSLPEPTGAPPAKIRRVAYLKRTPGPKSSNPAYSSLKGKAQYDVAVKCYKVTTKTVPKCTSTATVTKAAPRQTVTSTKTYTSTKTLCPKAKVTRTASVTSYYTSTSTPTTTITTTDVYTSLVPTATSYAACGERNMVSRYDENKYAYFPHVEQVDVGPVEVGTFDTALGCCEAVISGEYSGAWYFYHGECWTYVKENAEACSAPRAEAQIKLGYTHTSDGTVMGNGLCGQYTDIHDYGEA